MEHFKTVELIANLGAYAWDVSVVQRYKPFDRVTASDILDSLHIKRAYIDTGEDDDVLPATSSAEVEVSSPVRTETTTSGPGPAKDIVPDHTTTDAGAKEKKTIGAGIYHIDVSDADEDVASSAAAAGPAASSSEVAAVLVTPTAPAPSVSPTPPPKKSKMVILDGVKPAILPKLVDLSKIPCPMLLHDPRAIPPQWLDHRFPVDQGYLVPLYVAVQHRGVKLEDIDFVFGGSTLEILATKKITLQGPRDDLLYLVQKLPYPSGAGTASAGAAGKKQKVPIFMSKSSAYRQNYAEVGFQFERLVTGQPMDGRHSPNLVESMRLMKIGGFTILFSAEVEAVDPETETVVEVKAGKASKFGSKVRSWMRSVGNSQRWIGSYVGCDRSGTHNIQKHAWRDIIFGLAASSAAEHLE